MVDDLQDEKKMERLKPRLKQAEPFIRRLSIYVETDNTETGYSKL